MEEHEITRAINRARRGIKQYLEIMNMFPQTNVLHDHEFQKKYNAFTIACGDYARKLTLETNRKK